MLCWRWAGRWSRCCWPYSLSHGRSVSLSPRGSTLRWRDRLLLSWIAPRGIVAAAVSSLFALTLARSGYPQADRLVTVVFAIIIGTVVLQSLTSAPLARWLRVQQQRPRGVLIIGANSVARALALALQRLDIPVMLTDSSWEYYRQARMEGIPHGMATHGLNMRRTTSISAISRRCWRCRRTVIKTRWRFIISAIFSAPTRWRRCGPAHRCASAAI